MNRLTPNSHAVSGEHLKRSVVCLCYFLLPVFFLLVLIKTRQRDYLCKSCVVCVCSASILFFCARVSSATGTERGTGYKQVCSLHLSSSVTFTFSPSLKNIVLFLNVIIKKCHWCKAPGPYYLCRMYVSKVFFYKCNKTQLSLCFDVDTEVNSIWEDVLFLENARGLRLYYIVI